MLSVGPGDVEVNAGAAEEQMPPFVDDNALGVGASTSGPSPLNADAPPPVVNEKVMVLVKFKDFLLEGNPTLSRTVEFCRSNKAEYVQTKLAEEFAVEHQLRYNVILGLNHAGVVVVDGTSLQQCLKVQNEDGGYTLHMGVYSVNRPPPPYQIQRNPQPQR